MEKIPKATPEGAKNAAKTRRSDTGPGDPSGLFASLNIVTLYHL
jgi:hypothetical protein